MIDHGVIERAQAYVKERFETEYSGHDYFHTLRVMRMATRIAEREHANIEMVQLAALLHDVDDRKLSPGTYRNQANARAFMQSSGLDEETIEAVCCIVQSVSFGDNDIPPNTPEAKCVQDADRLDAMGAIGVGRAFAYGGRHQRWMHHPDIPAKPDMTKAEYVNHESTTINHFYEKLFKLTALMNTATAKEIAREREAYMRAFVSEFLDEWDGLR